MIIRTLVPIVALVTMAAAVSGDSSAQFVWKPFGTLQEGRNFFGAIPIGNGQVLVMGGYSRGGFGTSGEVLGGTTATASSEIIDARTRSIMPAGPMNVPHAESVFLLAPDSSVVAISGVSGTDWKLTAVCEVYDRATRSWKVLGNLIYPRRQHTACFINNDEFIVVGGRHENVATMAHAEIFNIRTGTSRLVADFPYPSNSLVSGTTPDGRVVAFGGREGGANSNRNHTVYAYDPVGNAWVVAGHLPAGLNAPHLLKLRNGDLVLSGGSVGESPLTLSTSVFHWRGSQGSGFTMAGHTSVGRVWHGQAQLDDNTIIITGGWGTTVPATRECDLVNLATGVQTVGPQLLEARRYSQTVSLPVRIGENIEMRVLAIAGQDERAATLATVEELAGTLLDAETGEFRQEEIAPNPTAGHVSIRLNLSSSSMVHLSLSDVLGKEVMRAEEPGASGSYRRDLSLRELPAGVYLLRVRAGERTLVRKIVRE